MRKPRIPSRARAASAIACALLCSFSFPAELRAASNDYFGLRIVDEQTGRGVPLVLCETVNRVKYYTDSAGWVAFLEPGLMDQRVFFTIQSHGYEFPKDGFGSEGVAVRTTPGARHTVKMKRHNLAERLYRITGQGIYRDSVLLGEPVPLAEPLGSGKVAGQDSTFAELYRGKIFWFWGDTARMTYPLGHFWMSCATSELPSKGGLPPSQGVNLHYLVDGDQFSRPVARLGFKSGPVWADGFVTLKDLTGRERLVCHYAHMESLYKMLGHGLAVFDDDKQEFVLDRELDMRDLWRFPAQAHPVRAGMDSKEYILTGGVFPTVRVPNDWASYFDLSAYEGFTCLDQDTTTEATSTPNVARTDGSADYRWVSGAKPIDPQTERKLVAAGKLKAEETHFLPVDSNTGKPIVMHRGSVRWNKHRNRWVMIATEIGGSSELGEVWYSESDSPTGPWRTAVKVVTHKNYSFYNPVHHAFFDEEDGRIIYFEGTYTHTFSGNQAATPWYDYTTIMYRLDVAAAARRLAAKQ